MRDITALTFDTGGTIFDWHSGLVAAFAECAAGSGAVGDWPAIVNEYRRRAMRQMTNTVDPPFNIDDVHRELIDQLVAEHALPFSAEHRDAIWRRWHELQCWPDFPDAFARLRARHVCVSFTILSLALVIDVSRRNRIAWDAVIPCEMMRVYKPRPEAYRRAAQLLQRPPGEILMVACHNFDLDAARAAGFRTAFVRRPAEWGAAGPPDPVPNPANDIIVDDFAALATALGA